MEWHMGHVQHLNNNTNTYQWKLHGTCSQNVEEYRSVSNPRSKLDKASKKYLVRELQLSGMRHESKLSMYVLSKIRTVLFNLGRLCNLLCCFDFQTRSQCIAEGSLARGVCSCSIVRSIGESPGTMAFQHQVLSDVLFLISWLESSQNTTSQGSCFPQMEA